MSEQATTVEVDLDRRWTVTGSLDGGYLTAVACELGSQALDGSPVLTASTHYLAPARGGTTCLARVEVVRRGRVGTVRVTLERAGRTLVEALVTCGAVGASPVEVAHAQPPTMPPLDLCPDAAAGFAGDGMDLLTHLELRLHPDDAAALVAGGTAERARVRSWLRYRDGRPTDTFLLTAAWDVLPPGTWMLGIAGAVPTVSSQVVLLGTPAPGPLLVEVRCDTLRDGVIDEWARAWDATGRLVSSGRQTAVLLPR